MSTQVYHHTDALPEGDKKIRKQIDAILNAMYDNIREYTDSELRLIIGMMYGHLHTVTGLMAHWRYAYENALMNVPELNERYIKVESERATALFLLRKLLSLEDKDEMPKLFEVMYGEGDKAHEELINAVRTFMKDIDRSFTDEEE